MTKEQLLALIGNKIDLDIQAKHSGKAIITVTLSQGGIQRAEYQPCPQMMIEESLNVKLNTRTT